MRTFAPLAMKRPTTAVAGAGAAAAGGGGRPAAKAGRQGGGGGIWIPLDFASQLTRMAILGKVDTLKMMALSAYFYLYEQKSY